MNVYSVPVTIFATAYVKAKTKKEAVEIAQKEATDTVITVEEAEDCEIEISGRAYNDPDLPKFSLSPSMTLARVPKHTGGVEVVEKLS